MGATFDLTAKTVTFQTNHFSTYVIAATADVTTPVAPIGVQYTSHVQHIGWQIYVNDGAQSGTTGKSLRLEALRITISGLTGYAVKYRVYVQCIGWMEWQTTQNGTSISDAAVAGTTGKSLRIEAVEIEIVK
jgi:uncharacterized protein YjdB